jgi:hypothetical protein
VLHRPGPFLLRAGTAGNILGSAPRPADAGTRARIELQRKDKPERGPFLAISLRLREFRAKDAIGGPDAFAQIPYR